MKRTVWVVIVTLAVALIGLMLSRTAFSLASISRPQVFEVKGVRYVSGGVGDDESKLMQAMAKDYPIEIVFIQRHTLHKDENEKEEYLADVKVKIQDRHLNHVLDIATEGPYLLAELLAPLPSSGMYLVTANYEGSVKQQWVYLNNKKHQRVIFWWPIWN